MKSNKVQGQGSNYLRFWEMILQLSNVIARTRDTYLFYIESPSPSESQNHGCKFRRRAPEINLV